MSQLRNVQLRQLRYFAATYEEKNVTRAAARLNIVQPALSMQLRKLEGAVGRKLFDRAPHGVVPTAEAHVFYRLCRPLLDDVAEIHRVFRQVSSASDAQVRVGVLPALDEESLLAEAISASVIKWSQIYPAAELKISEAYSSTLRRWTLDKVVDFAVVVDAARKDRRFKTHHLAGDSLAVITSADDALLPPGAVPLAALARLPLVLPSGQHGLRVLLNKHFEAAGLNIAPRLELDSMASAVRLVKSGEWATILPVSAVHRSIERRTLRVHEIVRPRITRDLYIVHLATHHLSETAERFVEILRSHLLLRLRDLHPGPPDHAVAASARS